MKILFLMSGAGLSGAETCLLRLAEGIKRTNENEVLVINTEEGILNRKLRDLGISVFVQPTIYFKKIYRITELLQLIKNIRAFRKIIYEENPDIIHAFTLPLSRRAFLLRKIGIKKPIIGTTHDTISPALFNKTKIWLFAKLINKNYEKLISVSFANRQAAIDNGIVKEKVEVIYNGISGGNANKGHLRTSNFVIGNFGRIAFGKGQHVTIEAVNILKNDIPGLKCFIIGDPPPGFSQSGEYYESLKRRVTECGIEDKVEFINWVDGLDSFYNKLDIYVLSSVHPDSFPTVNLEAMLNKIPVIATNIGGSKEQIINDETGFIIEPGNPELLTNKILYLYNHPDKAQKMGEQGYKRVTEEFTIKKYVDRHLSLYEKCINKVKQP